MVAGITPVLIVLAVGTTAGMISGNIGTWVDEGGKRRRTRTLVSY